MFRILEYNTEQGQNLYQSSAISGVNPLDYTVFSAIALFAGMPVATAFQPVVINALCSGLIAQAPCIRHKDECLDVVYNKGMSPCGPPSTKKGRQGLQWSHPMNWDKLILFPG